MAEADGKPKRILALFDEHFPYTIPAYFNPREPKKETPLLHFIKDFDPHILIHGGDQLDLDVIAHWNRGKPRLKEGARLKNVYDGYNALLDAIEKRTRSVETVAMLEGNHDYWIEDLLDEQPEMDGLVNVQPNLNLHERGYKWIGFRKHFKIGKLNFIHGNYRDGIGAANHAKAIAQIYCTNVVYGHYHTSQSYAAVTPFDEHPYMTTCVGTLANVNPLWRRNEPSGWLNGFWVGYLFPDGNFSGQSVTIVKNRFIFGGEIYQ